MKSYLLSLLCLIFLVATPGQTDVLSDVTLETAIHYSTSMAELVAPDFSDVTPAYFATGPVIGLLSNSETETIIKINNPNLYLKRKRGAVYGLSKIGLYEKMLYYNTNKNLDVRLLFV